MTAWEDFGLEVAKWVCIIFAAALLAGALIAATARIRDWRERVMWDRAEHEAQAAMDLNPCADITALLRALGYNDTPIYGELAAQEFVQQAMAEIRELTGEAS